MSESVSTLGSESAVNSRSKVPKVLIACSGSVATLKIPELVAELSAHFEVMVICTSSAAFFLEKSQVYNEGAWRKFELAGGWNMVLKDEDEWQMWSAIGNSVLHIEMRRWADILVVAPASANLISKASYGIADNFVLSVLRAWDFRKPCIICPAMNTAMWIHPTTKESLIRLKSFGYEILGPVEKILACNEKGNGAMVSVQDIKAFLLAKWAQRLGLSSSSNPLTNENLQLHSSLSTAMTTADSIDGGGCLNTTTATSDIYNNSITGAGKSAPQESSDFKTKLAAKSPGLKEQPPLSTATQAAVSTSAATTTDKPIATGTSSNTRGSPDSTNTTTTKNITTKVGGMKQFLLQSFMIGVGIGVGYALTGIVLRVMVKFGGSDKSELPNIRPHGSRDHKVSI